MIHKIMTFWRWFSWLVIFLLIGAIVHGNKVPV